MIMIKEEQLEKIEALLRKSMTTEWAQLIYVEGFSSVEEALQFIAAARHGYPDLPRLS